MSEQFSERWEARLRATAQALPYPSTPDVARAVKARLAAEPHRPTLAPRARLAWAVAAVLVALAGLLAVPQVRAGLLDLLRIGGVRIFLVAPTSTPTLPPPTALSVRAPTPTLQPTPTLLPTLLDLAGETTLEEAQAEAGFPIRLPTYPAGLGEPNRVFLQDFGGPMLILVWLDPDHPDQVRLSLHYLLCEECVFKNEPRLIQTTTVNGETAVWAEGPYVVQLRNGVHEVRRLIDGHVLIWVDSPITYRLETDLPLEEAVKIAESLK